VKGSVEIRRRRMMEKEWVCDCGVASEEDSEDEVAGKAQEDARTDHRQEISREEIPRDLREQHR